MLQPTTNKNSNINYQAKIFKLTKVKEHPNADKLVIVDVNHMPVVTSKDIELDAWHVYFPPESQINAEFLSFTNSFRNSEKNADPTQTGFFEDSGRVKTLKLRGIYSTGYIVPLIQLEDFFGQSIVKKEDYFDTINNVRLVKKYFLKGGEPVQKTLSKADKKASKVNIMEGQFKFHNDTENLRRHIYNLYPETNIEISYKLHGSSAIVSKLLFQKTKRWYHKLFRYEPKPFYDYVWSSRKVIKNKSEGGGYYADDIWTILKEDIKDRIPNGYALYGEIVGYLPSGAYIQKDYDYNVQKNNYDFYVYRISKVSADGRPSVELTGPEITVFCLTHGFKTPDMMFKGTVLESFRALTGPFDERHYQMVQDVLNVRTRTVEQLDVFRDEYLKLLENAYNEKNCYMCKNKVPEEGIVLRVVDIPTRFQAYKLKSFKFLAHETKAFDKGEINIEDNN